MSYLKGKCTNPSCEYGHPPECVKQNTNDCCKVGEKFSQTTMKRQAKSRKNNSKNRASDDCKRAQQSDIGLCISGRRCARTNDWTHVREAVHTEEERQDLSEGASRSSKCTKTAEIFIKCLELLGPSLGVVQGGPKLHRNPNAPSCADRDPNNTLWAEDDARKAAWQLANMLYRIRGTFLENEATFFKPKMEWRVASTLSRQS